MKNNGDNIWFEVYCMKYEEWLSMMMMILKTCSKDAIDLLILYNYTSLIIKWRVYRSVYVLYNRIISEMKKEWEIWMNVWCDDDCFEWSYIFMLIEWIMNSISMTW